MATSKVKDIFLFSVTSTLFLGLKTCTAGFYPGTEGMGSKAGNQILSVVELRMCEVMSVFLHKSTCTGTISHLIISTAFNLTPTP